MPDLSWCRDRRRNLAALAVAACLMAPALARGAGPGPAHFRLDYAVYVGGLDALQAKLSIDLGPVGYRVAMDLEPHGFFGTLVDWQNAVRVDGVAQADTLRPRHYQVTDSWWGRKRVTRLDFDAAGSVTRHFDPPEGDPDEVSAAERRQTYDPMSAIVAMFASARECRGSMPVYDGRRRFDLIFADQGRRQVAPSSYSSYAGPAEACQVSVRLIAGRWKQKRLFGPEAKDRPPTDLLLAPAYAGGPPVPVQLSMATALGQLVAHLTGVERLAADAGAAAGG